MHGRLSWFLALVAAHSILLGVLMLFWPLEFLGRFGWEYADSRFFPAQSGLFLLLLGIVYAVAIRERALVGLVVLSKAAAFVFLVSEVARGSGPVLLLLTAVIDGVMGAGVALLWWRERSAAPPA